ncbi:DUF996 domain-containing protein [Thermococcus sp. Bubb.Bath]|uniref:DUF996 domain-containing protein n=1 Tax=Thermococcus sp. Bubb.Bath TaxID=1638242 RepID=UPI00143928EF|nr:DUF996 domain-containing protein [Thermococcus sp. Bubb.Bath]NJF24063.1 DUF996 domain-containing protein [Thermococcus sp. Bubb.Bath]
MDTYDAATSNQVDVSSERSLGLIGAILALLALIPKVGQLLGLIGFVLVLISLHGIGEKTGNKRPFSYYLRAFIIDFVGFIIVILLLIGAFAMGVHSFSGSSGGQMISSPLGGSNPVQIISYEQHEELTGAGIGLVIAAVILIVLVIILGAYYEKRAWEEMARLTKVKEFNDAAKFIWWGALTFIILVGIILLLIGAIYRILAFSNMPQRLNLGVATQQPPEQFDVEEFESW